MRFRLNRISFRIFHPADHFHFRGLNFKTLALALRSHQSAGRNHRAARAQTFYFGFVIAQQNRCNNLNSIKAGAIAHIHETQARFGIAAGTHPTLDRDFTTRGNLARECLMNTYDCHALNPWEKSLSKLRRITFTGVFT